jgi:hypothetical protein
MIQDIHSRDNFEPSFPLYCWAASNLFPPRFASVCGPRGETALPIFSFTNDAYGFARKNATLSDHVLYSVTNPVMLCDLLDHVERLGFTHVVWHEVEPTFPYFTLDQARARYRPGQDGQSD